MLSYTSNNADRQDRPLLKPCWVLFRYPQWLKIVRTCFRIVFSITLLRTEVRYIRRYLLGKDLSPDLKTGIMAASLKEVGITLEERDCEKIIFKTGASSSAQLIRRDVGIPWGPPAEFEGILY